MISLCQFPELSPKKLIGVGEIAHGSSGLHEIEFELIRSLILDHGSRAIGIEAPSNIVEHLNRRLRSSIKEPLTKEVISELYPIWRSEKLLAGLQWIYDYNHLSQNHDDQIQLFGYDVRLPLMELKQLSSWEIARNDLKTSLDQFEEISLAELRDLEMLSHVNRSEEAFEKFNQILSSVDVILGLNRLPENIRYIAVKIRRWATIFKLWASSGMEPAYAERDAQMAEQILEKLQKENPKGPVVLLAHLNHLLFNNLNVRNSKSHVVAGPVMGNLLHKDLSDGYSMIGLFPNRIEIANSSTGEIESFTSTQNSFESCLQSIAPGIQILRVRDLPDRFKGWQKIGDVEPTGRELLETYSSYEMQIAEQLDFVVTIDEVKSEKLF